jgi:riboflavin kinase/FMN adenylyltransferase
MLLAMRVLRGYERLNRPVVAIGNFDGVHVGHRALLGRAVERARALGGEAAVLTFQPHPAKVLAPQFAPPLICTMERKVELFEEVGIDVAVLEPFTRELAGLAPEEFIGKILRDGLGAEEIVVGYDFTYGKKRGGNVETLRAGAGVPVHVIPAVTVDGLVASSTKIREFVLEGRVDGAEMLLGRPFDVDGEVVKGAQRGRELGIPTANIAARGELLPRPGIYVTQSRLPGETHWRPSVTSLGLNPTFGGDKLSLEVHLLDFAGDLYGQVLRTAFRGWLRAEERFTSVEALVDQIKKDIEAARLMLAG